MIEKPYSSGVFQYGRQAEFSTRLSAFVSDIESKGNFNEIKNDLKSHDRSRPISRGEPIISRRRHNEIIDFIFNLLSDDGIHINRERLLQFMLKTDVLNQQCKFLLRCKEAIIKIVLTFEDKLVKSDLTKCLHDIHKWMNENSGSSGVFQPGGYPQFSTRLSAFVSEIRSKGNFNEIKNDLKNRELQSRAIGIAIKKNKNPLRAAFGYSLEDEDVKKWMDEEESPSPRSRGDEKESPPSRGNQTESSSSRLGSGLEGLEGSMGSGANNEITARPARPQRSSSRYPGWTDEDPLIQMAKENAESSSSSPPSRGNQKESPLSRADQKESAPSIPRSKGRSGGFDVGFPDFHDDPCERENPNAPLPGEGQIPNDYSDCLNCSGVDPIDQEDILNNPVNDLVMLPSGNCTTKANIKSYLNYGSGNSVKRDPTDRRILQMNIWSKYRGGKKRKSKKARKVKKTMKKHKKTKRTKKTKNQHEKINKKRKSIKKHLRK